MKIGRRSRNDSTAIDFFIYLGHGILSSHLVIMGQQYHMHACMLDVAGTGKKAEEQGERGERGGRILNINVMFTRACTTDHKMTTSAILLLSPSLVVPC